MREALRRRPTPAMGVALLALFVALGGTSVALNKKEKKKVRNIASKQANKRINKKEPWLSVNHANTANTANHANTAGTANHANTAGTANSASTAQDLPDLAWQPLTLAANWEAEANRPPAVAKDAEGTVHLRGAVSKQAAGTDIFTTLPQEFRLAASGFTYLPIMCQDSAGAGTRRPGALEMNAGGTHGAVRPQEASTSTVCAQDDGTGTVFLDGVTFSP